MLSEREKRSGNRPAVNMLSSFSDSLSCLYCTGVSAPSQPLPPSQRVRRDEGGCACLCHESPERRLVRSHGLARGGERQGCAGLAPGSVQDGGVCLAWTLLQRVAAGRERERECGTRRPGRDAPHRGLLCTGSTHAEMADLPPLIRSYQALPDTDVPASPIPRQVAHGELPPSPSLLAAAAAFAHSATPTLAPAPARRLVRPPLEACQRRQGTRGSTHERC